MNQNNFDKKWMESLKKRRNLTFDVKEKSLIKEQLQNIKAYYKEKTDH